MPEPISLCLFLFGLKAASVKTLAAAPVKVAIASTKLAFVTGAAGTVTGGVLVGLTLTGATAVAIGAIIHRANAGGYMSEAGARAYAQKIEKLPLYRQNQILAEMESQYCGHLERVFNNNGVYA
jgi:hypothetical protein